MFNCVHGKTQHDCACGAYFLELRRQHRGSGEQRLQPANFVPPTATMARSVLAVNRLSISGSNTATSSAYMVVPVAKRERMRPSQGKNWPSVGVASA